jgi:hypothetical protein
MFEKKRRMQAMLEADRPGTRADASPEAAAFTALRNRVRAAEAETVPHPPAFDLMWSGVEARLAAASGEQAAPEAARGWRTMLGSRPLWVLAPAGALVMAAVLGYFVMRGDGPAVDNRCYVDSYDAASGTILVEQDLDDRAGVTVIWHLDEG